MWLLSFIIIKSSNWKPPLTFLLPDDHSFLIGFSTTLYFPNNSLKFAGQSLCDDNIQTTKFVTCQDRISQNYPFADFSSSAQTAAFFLSPKGHYTLVLSLSGIVSDSVSMVRKFLSFLLKNRCLLVKPNTGSPQLTRFSNSKVFWIAP